MSTHSVILPQQVLGGSTQRAVPSAQADQTQLPSGVRHVPGPARFESRRWCAPMTPRRWAGACHDDTACGPGPGGGYPGAQKTRQARYGPRVGFLRCHPSHEQFFGRLVSLLAKTSSLITPRCTRFIISVTSASSSLRNRQVAPLMPGPETPRWGRPPPSSIRPRLAKFSGF